MIADEIRTARLSLRSMAESDVTDVYLGWMTDPEVNRYLETRFMAPSAEGLREYVREMRGSANSWFFGIFLADDGRHVGNIKLGPVSSVHDSAPIGLVIGDRSVWGQGVATEAIGAIAEWAFSELGLAKVYAGSYAVNRGSVNAFLRNGFEIEGVQRRHVRLDTGERDDVVLLGRIRP